MAEIAETRTHSKTALADEIAAYLDDADAASCDAIARALHRRRADVLKALREDSRFAQTGSGRWSRWALASNDQGDGFGTDSTAPGDVTEGLLEAPTSEAGNGLLSRCSDPDLHRGGRAHYLTDDGYRCIRCDGLPPQPPMLTLEEWIRGEGGEDRQQEFATAWAMVRAGTATPEQRERFAIAVGGAP